ncbi:EEV glycoprotein [Tanapox virus]|uniref:EEV glycoprotein n=1 Tax=Tanapox virus TaxID=99000 RepID=A7XCR1_9POXV|nr:EEV glycoprotein [Tanapox virus]ABQ43757.1 EEV glycoprotein [Tanapox virus]
MIIPYIIVSCSLIILIVYLFLINKKYCKKFFKKKNKPVCIELKKIINTNKTLTLNSEDWTDMGSCEIYANFRSSKREKSFKLKDEQQNSSSTSSGDSEFDSTINTDDESEKLNWDNEEYKYDYDKSESTVYDLPQDNIAENTVYDVTDNVENITYDLPQDSIIYNLDEKSDVAVYDIPELEDSVYENNICLESCFDDVKYNSPLNNFNKNYYSYNTNDFVSNV